ncbi:hypothetical protein VPH35_085670 [Triticum aestivum]|uniref:Uncharacterized protein n=1 Tax=Triticum urartu TaxID=4572 RepID=A0A8R7QJ38_TRIUA
MEWFGFMPTTLFGKRWRGTDLLTDGMAHWQCSDYNPAWWDPVKLQLSSGTTESCLSHVPLLPLVLNSLEPEEEVKGLGGSASVMPPPAGFELPSPQATGMPDDVLLALQPCQPSAHARSRMARAPKRATRRPEHCRPSRCDEGGPRGAPPEKYLFRCVRAPH